MITTYDTLGMPNTAFAIERASLTFCAADYVVRESVVEY